MDEPPLPEITPPPERLVRVHGARLVRIYTIDHPDPRRREGFTEALLLAWAPVPGTRDWAVLTAWLGHWQHGGRTTGKGRWAWLRLADGDVARGRVRAATPVLMPEDEWHGHDPTAQFTIGARQAAASLPEQLRAQALQPRRDV